MYGFLRRVCAFGLVALVLLSGFAFAAEQSNERIDIVSFDPVRLTQAQALEWINENRLTDGRHVGARKNGYFETLQDKANAIVHMDVDVAGMPAPDPVDVLFVVDQSGSMNMYGDDNAERIACTCTCLNPKHGYMVRYLYKLPTTAAGAWEKGQYRFACSEFPEANMNDLVCYANEESFRLQALAKIQAQLPANATDVVFAYGVEDPDGTETLLPVPADSVPGQVERALFAQYLIEKCHVDEKNAHIAPLTQEQGFGAADDKYNGLEKTRYWSPDIVQYNGRKGCYDRAYLVHEAISVMAGELQANNDTNLIGYVGFANETVLVNDFAHDVSQVSGLYTHNGYNYTNYQAAFNSALELFSRTYAKDNARRKAIIFISDGIPTRGETSLAKIAAAELKTFANTEIFCIGMFSENAHFDFSAIASPDTDKAAAQHVYNCKTNAEDIEKYLRQILNQIVTTKATFTDTINASAFDVVVDEQHPITLFEHDEQGKATCVSYSSIQAAEQSGKLTWDPETNRFDWTLTLSPKGARMTYYLQMKDSARYLSLGSSPATYPTNIDRDTTVTYLDETYLVKHGADLTVYPPDPTVVAPPPPKTGDGATPALWLMLAVVSLLGLTALTIGKRRMAQR